MFTFLHAQVAEAAEILQEVAVETFGSMEKREKADFLLEQVRRMYSPAIVVQLIMLQAIIAGSPDQCSW